MAGQRAKENATFLTQRKTYRENIAAADALGPTDVAVSILDTRLGPNDNMGLGGSTRDTNQYAHNAQLNVSIIIEGFTSVTLELWLLAEVDLIQVPAPPANADPLPTTGEWVLADSNSFGKSSLWVVKDIPPGQYKILVSTVVGAGNIRLREQHAA